MFDKKRGISGELPEHIDFIKNRAIPVFEEWGYTVEILHATKDYLDCFHQIITKSKNPLRNGRKSGFPSFKRAVSGLKKMTGSLGNNVRFISLL